MNLESAINDLVKAIDNVTAEYWVRNKFTHSPAPTHEAQFISDKWAKIVVREHRNDGTSRISSVYGFVCLQDGNTKALGATKVGDIHKAATFKAPAKHARGNVFSDNFRECLTPHGIVYLK